MMQMLANCDKEDAFLKIVYLVVCGCSTLIAVVALGTDHWVNVHEGRLVANIIPDVTEAPEEDCTITRTCKPQQEDDIQLYTPPEDEPIEEPSPVLYIYSSIGLWRICYHTDGTEIQCAEIDYLKQTWSRDGDEGQVTMYISRGVRRCTFTAVLGTVCISLGTIFGAISLVNTKPIYGVSATVFLTSSAMFLFLTMIIFLAQIQNEASMAPPLKDENDEPLFKYMYGWSFHTLVASYLGANMATVISITLYIQVFRRLGHFRQVEKESSTEGDLIYANDTMSHSEVSIRKEISV